MLANRLAKWALSEVCLCAFSLLTVAAWSQARSHNSPVKMYSKPGSGTTHGGITTCGKNVWTHSFSLHSTYQTKTTIDSPSFVYFAQSGNETNLFPKDPLKAWIIIIDTKNIDGNPKTGAIKLCSDSSCSGQAIDGKIYLKGISGSRLQLHGTGGTASSGNGNFHFHDKTNGCGYLSMTDGVCDIISTVTILYRANAGEPLTSTGPLTCGTNGDGNCMIEIGNPDASTDICPIN